MANPSTRAPEGVTVTGTGDTLTVTCRGVSVVFTAAQLFEVLMNREELFPFDVG